MGTSKQDPVLECPLCRLPMRLKTNRGTGENFWGCSQWPKCNGSINTDIAEAQIDELRKAQASINGDGIPVPPILRPNWRWGRRVEVDPLRDNHRSIHIQCHVVDRDNSFKLYRRSDGGYWPHLGQFRLEHTEQGAPRHSANLAATLSVLEKILFRGRVVPAPKAWEKVVVSSAGKSNDPACSGWSLRLRKLEKESPAEEHFARVYLRQWLGSLWSVWSTPQVYMSCLVGGEKYIDSEQRVDMLISHPFLRRPIVVEIDGAAYHQNPQRDRARDADLNSAGYEVHRIPAAEIFSGAGPSLDRLADVLKPLEALNESLGEGLNDVNRRMGQLQSALFVAMRDGIVDCESAQPVKVWCDLVVHNPKLKEVVDCAIKDFISLFTDIGKLYGIKIFPAGVKFGELSQIDRGGVEIVFFQEELSKNTIYVDDVCFPWEIAWESADAKPLLPVNLDKNVVERLLIRIFEKEGFRDGQWEIISAGLSGQDTIALLPTGGGKSIAFQLTSMLVPGCSIVIAPILSLIRDQQVNLLEYGIDRVISITSDLANRRDREDAHTALCSGVVGFCYVAPERFQQKRFRENLRDMTVRNPVNFIVIDEAHCVSEWGIEFRTSYLRLGAITRRECGQKGWIPTLLALTGTASPSVLKDVMRELEIKSSPIRPAQLGRNELHLEVIPCSSDNKPNVLNVLLEEKIPNFFKTDATTLLARETPADTEVPYQGVIFCPHVNGDFGVSPVSKTVGRTGVDTRMHAGKPPKDYQGDEKRWSLEKRRTEFAFKDNEFPLLVATKAYGMGVDKPNIRYIVHYGMPSSIESFYQEVGRAGRDREDAYCVMLLSEKDQSLNDNILKDLSLIKLHEREKQIKFGDADDVNRCLYFHTGAFPGVDVELAVVEEALGFLSDISERKKLNLQREVPLADDDKYQKAIHRLTVLMVIRDYTLDYASNSYELEVGMESRESVVRALEDYIAGYSQDIANVQSSNFKSLAADKELSDAQFVLGMARYYLEFLYEIVEKGRRSAIFEMLVAARADDFDRRVRDYLQSTEYGRRVEGILGLPDAGLSSLLGLISDHLGFAGASGARGETGRMLEAYPDHPALLLLRGIAEERSSDGDPTTTDRFIRQALESAAVTYGVSPSAFATAVQIVYGIIKESSLVRAERIVSLAAKLREDDRDSVREIISVLGLPEARPAAISLLASRINKVSPSKQGQIVS